MLCESGDGRVVVHSGLVFATSYSAGVYAAHCLKTRCEKVSPRLLVMVAIVIVATVAWCVRTDIALRSISLAV